MSWTATRFSMIVLRISLTLKYALNAPGIAPHAAAAERARRSGRAGSRTGAGSPGNASAVAVPARPPIAIWPSPPMLKTFARKAMQMPTPTSRSGTALTAVLLERVAAAEGPGEQGVIAVDRVRAERGDHHRADEQRGDRRGTAGRTS